MAKPNALGVLGEETASSYLEERGYRIRERNFRSRFGEIDIIAEERNYLCFIEVKTRNPRSIAYPREAVTADKQRKLLKTAEYYIARHRVELQKRGLQPRFDCMEVYLDSDGRPCNLNHIANAF